MDQKVILILCNAQPLLSAAAEGMHHSHFTTFVCPASQPDAEQLLRDLLAQRELTIGQMGDMAEVPITGVSEDLRIELAEKGYGLSLIPMHFPQG